MHRPTVGILALVLGIVGAVFLFAPGDADSHQSIAAPLLRVATILGVLWLALPAINRPVSRWVLLGIVMAIVIFVRRPQLILLVLAFLAGIAILRPRLKSLSARQR